MGISKNIKTAILINFNKRIKSVALIWKNKQTNKPNPGTNKKKNPNPHNIPK